MNNYFSGAKDLTDKYTADTYKRFPITFVRGKGSLLYDETGKEYIDFGAGIAVNIFGTGNSGWANAVSRQARKLAHTSNLFYNIPQAELSQKLASISGADKIFFCNSGAEANECAIKCARKYSSDKYGSGRGTIISLQNSFHGRTLATLSATGQDVFHKYFEPFPAGFKYSQPNTDSLKEALNDSSVCAVMFEAIQGEGGVKQLDLSFVKEMERICKEKDILLIADEVQCGLGRTGKLFGYQLFDIKPDIVSLAKGLAGGLPMGATLMFGKASEVFTAGTHGSTFGGNPVCAAGALTVLDKLDDKLFESVARKGNKIKQKLTGLSGVKDISGAGLMLGIDVDDTDNKVIKCMEKGLIVLKAKNRIRLLPPLNIPSNLLNKGIEILQEVLK